jgi:hypothetical protein
MCKIFILPTVFLPVSNLVSYHKGNTMWMFDNEMARTIFGSVGEVTGQWGNF